MRQISRLRQVTSTLCIAVLLSSCGGGGGGASSDSGSTSPPVTVTPPVTPPPTSTACSLSSRLDWVTARLREDYLFPDLLATVPTAGVTNIQDYINAMTAPARAAGKDKLNFSYVTSIAEENALINSGSNAGFGIRFKLLEGNRLLVSEAYEGAPGLAAGLDRGVEILAIGTSAATLQNVADLIASNTLGAAIGPNEPGLSRTFRIRNTAGVESVVTATKATYALDPISDRYGSRIIDDGGRRVGYLNLRTFIVGTADQQLREVFANFKAQNVTEVIIDLRYNGGGLVSIAELLTNLLGAQRTSSDVQSRTEYNARNSGMNRTTYFAPQAQSIAPTKIAFIGTDATASASELVMNALLPYFGDNVALIGGNTFGKSVGQIRRDRPECDDAFRILAFRTVNRDNQGEYYDGLAPFFQRTCRASDDLSKQLGDPSETSIKTALDFLAGRPCTAISGGFTTQSVGETRRVLQSVAPSAAQYEIPGLF